MNLTFDGSIRITYGDTYNEQLANQSSPLFREKARKFKTMVSVVCLLPYAFSVRFSSHFLFTGNDCFFHGLFILQKTRTFRFHYKLNLRSLEEKWNENDFENFKYLLKFSFHRAVQVRCYLFSFFPIFDPTTH